LKLQSAQKVKETGHIWKNGSSCDHCAWCISPFQLLKKLVLIWCYWRLSNLLLF